MKMGITVLGWRRVTFVDSDDEALVDKWGKDFRTKTLDKRKSGEILVIEHPDLPGFGGSGRGH